MTWSALAALVERRKQLPPELPLLLAEEHTPTVRELQHEIGRLVHGEAWKTVEIPASLARVGAALEEKMLEEDPFIRPWMVDSASEHYEIDISRAKRLLDWRPRRSLRATLPKIIASLKADPAGWYRSNKLNPAVVADRSPRDRERDHQRTDVEVHLAHLAHLLHVHVHARHVVAVVVGVLHPGADDARHEPRVDDGHVGSAGRMELLPVDPPAAPADRRARLRRLRDRAPAHGLPARHVDGVWEPFFVAAGGRNGTETIITSDVSKAWPIADAGLGAVSYLFEVLMGVMGDRRRWRTMPWMVAAFGIVVVPLGVVSIYFIIIQPIMIGTWCTLCLMAAVAMLVMIPYTLDELVAMGQFLVQGHRRGESFWRNFFMGGVSPRQRCNDKHPGFDAPLAQAVTCAAWRCRGRWWRVRCSARH